jgi:two-component system, chemotaxis family, response regulator Rcp1
MDKDPTWAHPSQGKVQPHTRHILSSERGKRLVLRILLVEDNSADARLTGEILKDTGLEHELVWINEGKKAIDLIGSDGHFDLFIIDLNLPKASGLEVVSVLRKLEKFRTTPVIMMTGSIAPGEGAKSKGDALHYMAKPMSIEEMDRTVEAIKEIVLGKRS